MVRRTPVFMSSQNDPCVELLSAVRESDSECQKLREILDLEPTRRKRAINILVTQMRRENAPERFISAWDALQDDQIATLARAVIDDRRPETGGTFWTTLTGIAIAFAISATLVVIVWWVYRWM
jgi:hypothetical protein